MEAIDYKRALDQITEAPNTKISDDEPNVIQRALKKLSTIATKEFTKATNKNVAELQFQVSSMFKQWSAYRTQTKRPSSYAELKNWFQKTKVVKPDDKAILIDDKTFWPDVTKNVAEGFDTATAEKMIGVGTAPMSDFEIINIIEEIVSLFVYKRIQLPPKNNGQNTDNDINNFDQEVKHNNEKVSRWEDNVNKRKQQNQNTPNPPPQAAQQAPEPTIKPKVRVKAGSSSS